MALFKTEKVNTPLSSIAKEMMVLEEETDFLVCKNPEKLGKIATAVRPGASVHYISDGDWSMHNLVQLLLQKYSPTELYITTYALRELAVRQIITAMDEGKITAVNMLVDVRAKTRTPEVFQLAAMNFAKIHLMAIHAKVTVIKTDTSIITIEGSANWTSNPRIEQGFISMNKDLGNFHIDWIKNAMNGAQIFE